MPAEIDWSVEGQSCKQNTIGANSTNNLKIFLILLAKLVVIYVRLPIIYVGEINFEQMPLRAIGSPNLSLSKVHKNFYELIEIFIGVLSWTGHKSWNGNKNKIGGIRRSKSASIAWNSNAFAINSRCTFCWIFH